MEIKHYDAIPHTPALRLAVRCWHELMEAGHIGEGSIAIGWDHKAIVAFADDGTPIGVLTWVESGWANEIYAALAYVLPNHRRGGVLAAMWQELVGKAVELKRPIISASVALDNLVSRSAAKANGLVETGATLRYSVPGL